MKKIGYIYASSNQEYVTEQIASLKELEVINLPKDSSDLKIDMNLKQVVNSLEAGDQLVIHELRCLGKSIIQLADFLQDLKERGIKLIVKEKGTAYQTIDDDVYLEMILKIAEMEKTIIRERTTKGLQEARKNGRVGGRPKISKETIEQIRHLYNNNRYTLRQIAEECNISLGTAYKYVQER
ncbi:recombinase family protein [Vagococcus sp.]|uniref:recombinase family protein n=1 Tax=Vagococcus sp. TaxID=1933889 RepID=UPI003F97AE7F